MFDRGKVNSQNWLRNHRNYTFRLYEWQKKEWSYPTTTSNEAYGIQCIKKAKDGEQDDHFRKLNVMLFAFLIRFNENTKWKT